MSIRNTMRICDERSVMYCTPQRILRATSTRRFYVHIIISVTPLLTSKQYLKTNTVVPALTSERTLGI